MPKFLTLAGKHSPKSTVNETNKAKSILNDRKLPEMFT